MANTNIVPVRHNNEIFLKWPSGLSTDKTLATMSVEAWRKMVEDGNPIADEIEHERRMTPERQRAVEICRYIKNHYWETGREKEGQAANFCKEAVEGKYDMEHDGIKRIEEKYAKNADEIESEQKARESLAAMEKLGKLTNRYYLIQFCELVEENGEVFVCIDVHDKLNRVKTYKGKTLAEAINTLEEK